MQRYVTEKWRIREVAAFLRIYQNRDEVLSVGRNNKWILLSVVALLTLAAIVFVIFIVTVNYANNTWWCWNIASTFGLLAAFPAFLRGFRSEFALNPGKIDV